MRSFLFNILIASFLLTLAGCKDKPKSQTAHIQATNTVSYASGLAIYKYKGYSVVKVSDPWPDSQTDYTYILKEKNTTLPDSLSEHTIIPVPLQSVVVTSTTNVPFLEMLGVENKLVGFPDTDYVSSEKTRALIDKGLVKNVGENEKLNIEELIELSPSLIVTFGVDNNNPMLSQLQKSGLKVLIQADWMEQSPLGKAEWIKLYGALFGKEAQAQRLFDNIVANYQSTLKTVENIKPKTTVLYGSMYRDQWYVAKGESWVARFLKDARADYIWKNEPGSGSLGLSFENILEKAKHADCWIAAGTYNNLRELEKSNPHYSQFDAFKNKNVYTFEARLGATGGIKYYELAPSRPDLVLKDYIRIFHPHLLPDYSFTFATKLE